MARYIDIHNYFSYLVSQTNEIKDFVGVSKHELQNKLARSTTLEDPFLVLYGYEGKLDGNQQRTIGRRTISFAIVFRVKDPNDYDAQYQRISDAEDLGMQVLARIKWDALEGQVDWLNRAFQKDSVKFNEVVYENANGLFGCEFHFDLELKNPLKAENDFWLDKDFC